jgi:hypothetical protein
VARAGGRGGGGGSDARVGVVKEDDAAIEGIRSWGSSSGSSRSYKSSKLTFPEGGALANVGISARL